MAGGAGLNVEGDRFVGFALGAGHVAEFDQLVADQAGVAVGDGEVAFAGPDGEAGEEFGGHGAGGADDGAGLDGVEGGDGAAGDFGLRLFEQPAGGDGGVDDGVSLRDGAAGEAGAEVGFGFVELFCVEEFDARFATCLFHFGIVGGDPECAAVPEFGLFGEVRGEGVPEADGVAGEVVIEIDEVAHACGGGAAAGDVGVEEFDGGAGLGEFIGAGRADDARADDDDVGHQGIPWMKGSEGSSRRRPWALTQARPLMVGRMRSPSC